MFTFLLRWLAGLACVVLFAATSGCAEPGPRLAEVTPARTLGGVSARPVTLMSEGTRLAGTVYTPAGTAPGAKLPTVVMANGWGAVAAQLEPDALRFARAGYLVLTFDYRGWGASDARVLLTKPHAAPAGVHRYTAEVEEVRGVVDPEDMVADWLNALHWLHGEPQCDAARIGLWGTGVSGGMIATVAARDGRVKALYSRSGLFPSASAQRPSMLQQEATRRARGEIGYPAAGAQVASNRLGAPIAHRFFSYSPIDDVRALKGVPLAIVIASVDDVNLFLNSEHGLLAHERHPGPKKLVTLQTTHHALSTLGNSLEAHEIAQAWFDQHLKAR